MRVSGYRIHAWGGDLQWEAFDVPEPRAGEVGVRVEACGIGLTVLNCMRGDLASESTPLPRVPGHEIVGRIETIGPGVASLAVGQRVMAYFYLVCGRCEACRSGEDSLCRDLAGWVGVNRDGGYAPYAVLPALNVLPLPESMPAAQATAIPDAIATSLHVCRARARVRPGDRVAVIGAGGGVGIHMVEVATLLGARVAGLEASQGKLDAIRAMGGTPVLSASFESLDLRSVWRSTGATVVIDLVGTAESLAWGLKSLALGGRMVVLTTFPGVEVPVSARDLVLREAALIGSRYASRSELIEAAGLVSAGTLHPMVSQVVSAAQVGEVHRALRAGTLVGRGALDWSL
jgi:propanol-preferring alcohol dehydrogenase